MAVGRARRATRAMRREFMMAVVDQLMCTASSDRAELRSLVENRLRQSFARITCSRCFVSYAD